MQLHVGDTIMAINGKACESQSVDSIRSQLNGPPGTAVPSPLLT